MKLEDLYKKSVESSSRVFEVVKSDGTMSGHHITLIDPFSAKAAKLVHMFDRAIAVRLSEFEKNNKALLDKCEKSKDFTDYNLGFDEHCSDIRAAFAAEIVDGWDFDNKFTDEALKSAIESFSFPLMLSLERQIINAFKSMAAEHSKK